MIDLETLKAELQKQGLSGRQVFAAMEAYLNAVEKKLEADQRREELRLTTQPF